MDLLASLHFSLSITGPICLVLVLGIWLKRLGLLPDSFVESASRLVFQVTLPALLFLSMVRTDFSTMPSPWLILYGLLGTLAGFLVLELLAARFIPERLRVIGGFAAAGWVSGEAYLGAPQLSLDDEQHLLDELAAETGGTVLGVDAYGADGVDAAGRRWRDEFTAPCTSAEAVRSAWATRRRCGG